MREVIGNDHAGQRLPRSIESCLFIIFHGWNTIEAGHVY
jgi:hypothetical protein